MQNSFGFDFFVFFCSLGVFVRYDSDIYEMTWIAAAWGSAFDWVVDVFALNIALMFRKTENL